MERKGLFFGIVRGLVQTINNNYRYSDVSGEEVEYVLDVFLAFILQKHLDLFLS